MQQGSTFEMLSI